MVPLSVFKHFYSHRHFDGCIWGNSEFTVLSKYATTHALLNLLTDRRPTLSPEPQQPPPNKIWSKENMENTNILIIPMITLQIHSEGKIKAPHPDLTPCN